MGAVEGTGGARPSTTTTSSSGTGKPGESAPSTTTTTTPTRRSGSRGTGFSRGPARDTPSGPSLREAAQASTQKPAQPTSTSRRDEDRPSNAPASAPRTGGSDRDRSTPAQDRPASPTSGARDRPRHGKGGPSSPTSGDRARPTSGKGGQSPPTSNDRGGNDGRATNLQGGNHTGSRDAAVAKLKEQRTELLAERRQVRKDIGNLESEIKGDENKAGMVGAVVDAVTSPVTVVAGIFGASNPIRNAAEGAVEQRLGVEQDKRDLEAKESRLATQTRQIEAQIQKLEDERVLNFLADTAHVTSMDANVAAFIEDGELEVGGQLRVRLDVAKDTGTGSDGVFDSGTDTITVDSANVEDARKNMAELRSRGIVDEDGNIVDAEAFDASAEGDDVIKTVSLVGVHEVNHAQQHANADFEQAFEAKEAIMREAAASIPADASPAQAAQIMSRAEAEGERVRTQAIEVESYTMQEQNDLAAGARKKAFITVDEHGKPLPEEQRLANVLAYQEGRPLEYGASVGYVRESAQSGNGGDDPGHEHGHGEGDHAHDHVAEENRGPGYDADGHRGPGHRGPGYDADGHRGPGHRGPGYSADGFLAMGFTAAGFAANGHRGPGHRGPGHRGPGHEADGHRGPGHRGPGHRGPGYEADGHRGPGYEADGHRGPGHRGPGYEADGHRGPGHRGPGYEADGHRGPGHRGPGHRGPGHAAD